MWIWRRRGGYGRFLNGSKTFITGGMDSDYFVVGARTGGPGLTGISLFFVEKDAPGFSRTPLGKKMGWWASNQATLYFDDCRVPATNLMGQEDYGFLAIVNNFNNERLGMAAQCVGMMKAALEDSIAWAQERETFGKPLIKHQVIRHKIANMSAKIDMIESYIAMICWNIEQGDTPVAELSLRFRLKPLTLFNGKPTLNHDLSPNGLLIVIGKLFTKTRNTIILRCDPLTRYCPMSVCSKGL